MLGGEYAPNTKTLDQSPDAAQSLPPEYQLTRGLIKASKIMIREYDSACGATVPSAGSPIMEFMEDNDCWKLTNVLEKRRKEVKHRVNGYLSGNNGSGKDSHETVVSQDKGSNIWTTFAKDEENVKDQTMGASKDQGWAEAAKHAQRGVRRITKYLPGNAKVCV